MTKTVISVTEAARKFSDCVNRVHYQNVTFVLLKNGTPVARLVPDSAISNHEKLCTGRDLAETLRTISLPPGEAKAWGRDLRASRKRLKSPTDRWK